MNKTNENSPATVRQLKILAKKSGLDTTNCVLSVRTANNLIDNAKCGVDISSDLRSFGAKRKLVCSV